MTFTTSWNKQRWKTARQQKELFKTQFGKDVSVQEFYKNKNPLLNKIKTYNITFEMKHLGESYEFFIPQETFTITSFDSPENKATIEENTKQAIAQIFRGKGVSWVYDHLEIKVRGIENETTKYNKIDVNKLKLSRAYTDNLPQIEVNKKSKGSDDNINKYKLDLWL